MTDRRKLVPLWLPLLFGLMALTNVISRGRVATYYGPDVVQLVAVGLCFGVSLATLVRILRERRSN